MTKWEDHLLWKNNARCAVMLSFDLDGVIAWKNDNSAYPGGENFIRDCSIGDYGPNRGAPALLDLLKKYDIPATFFIPGIIAEAYPDLVRRIADEGHEIGLHGYTHEMFLNYDEQQQADIIDRCQNLFCDLIGRPLTGFRTPSGDWSSFTPRLLVERGVNYSSSMNGNDRPYHTVIDGKKSDLIEIPAHVAMDDWCATGYNYFPPDPEGQDRIFGYDRLLDNWIHEYDGYYEYGLCFSTTHHPQVIGTPGRLRILEKLICHMKDLGNVWFGTGKDIADWYREHYDYEEALIK